MTDFTPFSTPGMYSLGTMPPMTLFSNSKPRAGRVRLDRELHARELAGAAGLLLVGVVDLGRLA